MLEVRGEVGVVGKGKGRCGDVKKCGRICWRVYGVSMGSVETCVGVEEGKGKCESVKKCGRRCARVYGVNVESVESVGAWRR